MAKGKKPKVGSRAWEKSLRDNPKYMRHVLQSLTDRAAKGDAEAAEELGKVLADRPELRPAVRQLDDLAVRVEGCWVSKVAYGDKVAETAVREQVEKLKTELLGDSTGMLDKILASAVAVAHLAYQHAAAMASVKGASPGVAALRDRRLTAAQRRLFDALKGWELVARKRAKLPGSSGKLKLFDPERVTA